jgi:chaperonin GroES
MCKSQSGRRTAPPWTTPPDSPIFPRGGFARPFRNGISHQTLGMERNLAREVIVVGDKVLIKPEEEASKTPSGLYLPQGVATKEAVAGGYIVNVGPGYPTAEAASDGEPWSGARQGEMRYVPLQASQGDYAIFLRKESIEVEIDGNEYLIVGHSSILLLIRDRTLRPGL